jgi:hypothetical protein
MPTEFDYERQAREIDEDYYARLETYEKDKQEKENVKN